MKNKTLRAGIAILGAIVFIIGCSTLAEKKKVDEKVEGVEQVVKVGGDIYQAREKLVEMGFQVTEVIFTTVSKTSLSCVVKVNERDQIDGLSYAIGQNLRPWRSGINHHVVISAGTDGTIKHIEAK